MKQKGENKKVTKKVLIVIAPEKFRDEELGDPIAYFDKVGVDYDLVSTKTGLVRGMLGDEVLVDKTFTDISHQGISSYDAIMIVGGGGSPTHLWDNRQLHAIIQDFEANEKIIGAICLSPVVLAHAGLLQDKKATVFIDDTAIKEIQQGGAIFTPLPVVVDGRIVTANGPQASGAFAEKLVRLMEE